MVKQSAQYAHLGISVHLRVLTYFSDAILGSTQQEDNKSALHAQLGMDVMQ